MFEFEWSDVWHVWHSALGTFGRFADQLVGAAVGAAGTARLVFVCQSGHLQWRRSGLPLLRLIVCSIFGHLIHEALSRWPVQAV
jgi:hypothetical protein